MGLFVVWLMEKEQRKTMRVTMAASLCRTAVVVYIYRAVAVARLAPVPTNPLPMALLRSGRVRKEVSATGSLHATACSGSCA